MTQASTKIRNLRRTVSLSLSIASNPADNYLLFLDLPQDLGRVSGHDRPGGNVLGDDGPGPDDGAFAARHPGQDGHARSDRRPLLDQGRDDLPVGFRLEGAAGGGRSRVHIVDKSDVMADEDVVLDGHALPDEGVRGDLAVPADECVFLDLDERPDPGVVPDRAAVEVDEGEDLDVFPELDVGGNTAEFHGCSFTA